MFKGLNQQSGVTLIEVLISMVVLAVGMLGIAAVLMVSLRNSQGSMQQSQAVIQSYAMLDSLRANKPSAIIGQYNMPDWTCNPPSDDTRIGAELNAWITNLHSEVDSSACGKVVCSSLQCEVDVQWDDSRATGGDSAKSYSLITRI